MYCITKLLLNFYTLRTLIRTFEAQITEKIRTSNLCKKKGVLIKKRCIGLVNFLDTKSYFS